MQVWRADFSKSCYLQQVYQPRYLVESPRLFGPWYLEVRLRAYTHICCAHEHRRSSRVQHGLSSRPSSCPLRCTSWSNSPLAHTLILPSPLILLHPLKALVAGRIARIAFVYAVPAFFLGNVVWTILEYIFHLLPDHSVALTVHFLMHGIHHYLPMDRSVNLCAPCNGYVC